MSDLHLTDEQVKELKSMGPLGEEAVYELGLWRDTNSAPWTHSRIDAPEDGYFHIACPVVVESMPRPIIISGDHGGDADAICHARNTAELRAALVYWTLWLMQNKHHGTFNSVDGAGWMQNRIVTALEEMKS